jgi:hypothetical protein
MLVLLSLLSACSTSEGLKLPFGLAEANLTTVPPQPDSCPTPQECALELKRLVSDPNRDWIGRPQSADAYANGTRLFAYRILRKKLTCEELHRGLADTETASSSLKEPRYQRARPLAVEVLRELKAEHTKRCRARS